MSWGGLLVNLVVSAVVVAVLMLATFGYAMRTGVHAIMDTVWPLGFVIIALVSFGLSGGDGEVGRRVLVLVLTGLWGLRLGAHIFARNFGQGEDKRYASLLRRNRGDLASCGGSGPIRLGPGRSWIPGCGATPGTRITSVIPWCGSGCGCWPVRTRGHRHGADPDVRSASAGPPSCCPAAELLRAANIMIAKTFSSSPSWGKKSS